MEGISIEKYKQTSSDQSFRAQRYRAAPVRPALQAEKHMTRPLGGRCIVRLLRHLQLVAEHLLRSVPVRLSPCAIQREWQIRMLRYQSTQKEKEQYRQKVLAAF